MGYNGVSGKVIELVSAAKKPAPHPPLYLVVMFGTYLGVNWSAQERYNGCVLIAPVDATWANGAAQARTQLRSSCVGLVICKHFRARLYKRQLW